MRYEIMFQRAQTLVSNRRLSKDKTKAFTLIELLIVIAIILILIAIALPNFLEAQIRARVTKAKGEIRSLGIAMESYALDFTVYPSESEHDMFQRGRTEAGLAWLTSPIAYISSIPEDPFGKASASQTDAALYFYEMGGVEAGPTYPKCFACLKTWTIFTKGPDGNESDINSDQPHWGVPGNDLSVDSYNPTNGTSSEGDIFLYGGDGFWIGVNVGIASKTLYVNPAAQDVGLTVNRVRYLHRLPPGL